MDQDLNSFAKESGVGKQRWIEAALVLDFAPDLVEKIFTGGIRRQQAAAALAVNRALKRKGEVAPIQSLWFQGCFSARNSYQLSLALSCKSDPFFYCPVGTSPDSKSCNGFNN
jgi:hypothetical protein